MPATTPRPPSSEQVAAFDRNAWSRSIGIPGRNPRNPHGIPKPVPGWSNLAVFTPHSQRIQLVKKNIAPLVDSYRGFRLWPEQLAEHAAGSVMLFRGWMMRDLDRAKALSGAKVFWSQWDGYLAVGGAGAALKADCEARDITLESIHTSGHASAGA